MKLFRVIAADNTEEYVYEDTIGHHPCNKCGIKMEIVATERDDYTRRVAHKVQCPKCKGHYTLVELSEKEKQEALKAFQERP